MELKPLFFILILVTLLLTPGCLESSTPISPPFSTSQFVRQATDLNYTDWKAGDYNNMVLVFDGNKISVADANDLNVALPDLSGLVPYTSATGNVNLGEHNLRASGVGIGEFDETALSTYKLGVAGKTLLTDKLAFTQDDGKEYIDSLNDGYMDYGATTAHRFDSPITQTINSTATTGQLFLRNDGTGDSAIKWGITGDSYIAGIDNSDSDAWKLSFGYNSIDSATLGTSDQIKIIGTTSTQYYYGGNLYFGNPNGPYDISYYLNGQSKKLRMTWREDEGEFVLSGGSMNNGNWIMPDIYNGFNKFYFGTGKDSFIGYDGSNMLINPNEVGSGYLNIKGQTLIDDKIMFTQTDGNEYIDSLNDGYMDYGATTAHRFSGAIHAVHKASDGTSAVADGTYTVGIGGTTNGTITIKDGIIIAVQEAVA